MAGMRAHSRSPAQGRTQTLVDGLPIASFLRRYWQKEALVIRSAIPRFRGPFTAANLFALAQRDDVESRLVVRERGHWSLAHGPFRRADIAALPARNWTLLVQGVNLVSAEGDALLRRFAFLPYARLDDLMVSYAAPGGGVGPHVDSYDVFLLQGFGRRRWRYGRNSDGEVRPRLPLKILKRFAPRHAEVLAAGDILYLPPQYAHDGVALEACTTYSIGFRAASAEELARGFLDYLHDELEIPGRYADPDLTPAREPAEIDGAMRRRCARMLKDVRWDRTTIDRFLGCWLSEPKASVAFDPPSAPLTRSAFGARAAKRGLRLDPRTQLLYDPMHLFINGTALRWPAGAAKTLRRLANERALSPRAAGEANTKVSAILYTWYRDGYLHTDNA
jgi:50S ribosomal protein L16 3-hydroxylase